MLPPDVEGTIYRLVQEALNKVVKHSDAARATVGVTEDGDRVRDLRARRSWQVRGRREPFGISTVDQ
jgi:signal transduction histidine kinase